jgi:hypothetical protein
MLGVLAKPSRVSLATFDYLDRKHSTPFCRSIRLARSSRKRRMSPLPLNK